MGRLVEGGAGLLLVPGGAAPGLLVRERLRWGGEPPQLRGRLLLGRGCCCAGPLVVGPSASDAAGVCRPCDGAADGGRELCGPCDSSRSRRSGPSRPRLRSERLLPWWWRSRLRLRLLRRRSPCGRSRSRSRSRSRLESRSRPSRSRRLPRSLSLSLSLSRSLSRGRSLSRWSRSRVLSRRCAEPAECRSRSRSRSRRPSLSVAGRSVADSARASPRALSAGTATRVSTCSKSGPR